MAESKEAAPETEAQPKKKSKLIPIILYLVATVVLLGAGTVAGVLVIAPKLAPPPPPAEEADGGGEHGAAGGNERHSEPGKDAHAAPSNKDDAKHAPAADAKAAPAAAAADSHSAAPGAGHGPSFVTLPPLVINVSQEQKQRFLRLTLAVEVGDTASEAVLKKNIPKAVDAIQIYLRTQSPENFTRIASLMQIRSDLLQRIRQIDQSIDAKGVLFQDLMVQ